MVAHHANLAPEREAIVWENVRITYGELDKLSNRVANALVAMGIGRGDKVALSCPNLPFFPIVYYGIMKAGAAVVPLSVLFAPREVVYHLTDSDAKAMFVFEGTPDLPLAETVKKAFDEVPTCEQLVVMTRDLMGASPFAEHKTLTQLTFDKPETFDIVATSPDDTCRDPLHVGHDGPAKRCRTYSFQPVYQRCHDVSDPPADA